MALKIIEDGTAQEHTVAGSIFHFTPCGWADLMEVRSDCRDSTTLRIKDGAVETRLLLAHIVGWENVLDAQSKPLPYTSKALMHLPGWVIDELVVKILEGVQEENAEQGNSESSSTT